MSVWIEKAGPCDDCGKMAMLRPYGVGFTWICEHCSAKDKRQSVARAMAIRSGSLVAFINIGQSR